MKQSRNDGFQLFFFANGEEIVCTAGHPFFVVGVGFIAAKDLKLSDKLLLSDGKPVIIEEIKIEQVEIPENTYNFEVEDFHTYYVGEYSICVHNAGCGGVESKTVAGPEDVGNYKDVRIDVEIVGSGKTNIHMHAKGLKKMYYDVDTQTFSTAPKKLRESQFVKKGIQRAKNYIARRNG